MNKSKVLKKKCAGECTPCYLMNRQNYLLLTEETPRNPNGSIWG